jgi:hypothetical protein
MHPGNKKDPGRTLLEQTAKTAREKTVRNKLPVLRGDARSVFGYLRPRK